MKEAGAQNSAHWRIVVGQGKREKPTAHDIASQGQRAFLAFRVSF